jgi:hypothetical protein
MTGPAHARARRAARTGHPGPGRSGAGRVRVAAGTLLAVVTVALVLAEGWVRAGSRQPVLALARPVAAGQVITRSDLRVVRVSAAGPVALVPAARLAQVAGRAAAAGLPAGSLLAAGDIAAPSAGRGQALLGVVLRPGRYPPGLSPGQRVAVLAVRVSGRGGRAAMRVTGVGVVLSVTASPAAGGAAEMMAEVEVPQDAALRVAAATAAGQVTLAAIPAGG